MKRLITLYVVSFCIAITSFSLSLAGLLQPNWIHFETPRSSPISLTTDYGLFKRCDRTSWLGDSTTCRRFPTRSQDCNSKIMRGYSLAVGPAFIGGEVEKKVVEQMITPNTVGSLTSGGSGDDEDQDDSWTFCDSWITAGYFQQLSLVFGFAAVLACFAATLSPLYSRRKPYRLISSLLFVHSLTLIASSSLVVHEFNTDDRFVYGSRLAGSYIMTTIAWSLDVLVVASLVLVVGVFKVGDEERGYTRIGD